MGGYLTPPERLLVRMRKTITGHSRELFKFSNFNVKGDSDAHSKEPFDRRSLRRSGYGRYFAAGSAPQRSTVRVSRSGDQYDPSIYSGRARSRRDTIQLPRFVSHHPWPSGWVREFLYLNC